MPPSPESGRLLKLLICDECDVSGLLVASISSSLEMEGPLIEAGANVNALSKNGWPLLCDAAMSGNISAIHTLLNAGADVRKAVDVGPR